MKKQTGIWIDGSKAIIVNLQNGQEQVTEIEAEIENRIYHEKEGNKGTFMGGQHINNEKMFNERKDQQIERYLKQVVQIIKDADELYLFGPAEIKLKLSKKIRSEAQLGAKLKHVEAADSMTNNQVVAQVKKYFTEQANAIKAR